MTLYNLYNVNLSKSQLSKVKLELKNLTKITLYLFIQC